VVERRIRRPRALPQTRYPLFSTTTRGKATTFSTISMQRLVCFARRKVILRNLAGRSNPYEKILNVCKGRRKKILPQTNNKLEGTGRK
jgi:hypothetical protein